MAVTRINNNQITDASTGNVYTGVNAASKIQNYTITSTKIANNLTYGSDLTVTGNLTVNGTTTTIDTVNTLIQDPLITLADGQTTGTPAVDIGTIGLRGSELSAIIAWKEDQKEFVTILSNTTISNTTVNVNAYANLHMGNATIQGTTSLVGNLIGAVNATDTITGGNLVTAGTVSAAGTITGGNIDAGSGIISTTGNITGGNVLFGSGIVSGTGNIYANKIFADIAGNIDAAGSNTQVQFNDTGDLLGASAGFTFDKTANLLTVTGNVDGGNITTGGQVVATATITGGNIATSGTVSATGNITGGNVTAGSGLIVTTGNINGGNINVTNVSLTGNVVSDLNVTTDITGDNITAIANITGANLSAGSGLIVTTGNINGGNINTENIFGTTAISLNPGTGNITVNNTNINDLADPSDPQDAATKAYVDSVAQGLDIKASVTLSSTSALPTYTYNNGTAGVGATLTATTSGALLLDGQAVTANARVLIKNETASNAPYNGIYVVTATGDGSNPYVLTRASDFDNGTPSGEIPGAFTFVEYGNTLADTGWVCTTNSPVTVGTTDIVFVQFSGAGSYTAGDGLSLTGTQFNVLTDGNANPTVDVNGSNQLVVPAGAAFTTPNIGVATGTSLSVTSSVVGITLSASGNVVAGNVTTSGSISATGNVDSGNINTTNISLTGNVITDLNVIGNVNAGNVNAVIGITAATGYFTGNVDVLGNLNATVGVVYANSGIFYGDAVTGNNAAYAGVPGFTQLGSNVVMQFAGNVNAYSQLNFENTNNGTQASGDFIITADNGDDSTYFIDLGIASSNWDGSQPNSLGNALFANDSYLYAHDGNLVLAAAVAGDAVKIVAGGSNNDYLVATINNTGVLVSGVVSATGNITGSNINTVGTLIGGNIVISGDNITDTNGRINFNTAGADVDFAVNADTVANAFYVDAGTGTASFGSATQTTNAIVAFNATTSILMPTGITSERPGVGVTGMVRFNTTNNNMEVYDNSQWTAIGVPVFTVIDDEQFNGDGVTVNFTLASTQTTNSCIVSINGVVQIPTIAYSVSGTDPTCVLTFTEAPATGDIIDVRQITTTTTVTSIANSSGNAVVAVSPIANDVNITGDIIPTGNGTQSLGSNTNRFSEIWLTGNTITLGSIVMKDTGGQIGFFEANGTTPATIDSASVDTTTIANGTSSVAVIASGGNIRANIGGATIINITSGGIENGQANGVGNIGSSSSYFNTVFAKATSAQYADLAEKYVADAEYVPGTVVVFGGTHEVTVNAIDADRKVAGVVSTNPSYIMNGGLEAEHVATVALTGRVPCMVVGLVRKGDMMVAAGLGRARAEKDPKVGTVIGKALEDFDGTEGTIEVVVGRF